MKKVFLSLAILAMAICANAQTNQYFWYQGNLMMGNPIAQIDSVTFGEGEPTDTLHILLPRTIIKTVHDTVKIVKHDTVYINKCLEDNGALPGEFSVSPTKKVRFSQGNLQYNAALGTHQCADGTTKQGTWRFAEHQWDMVGMGYGLTNTSGSYYCYIGGTVQNGDNQNISSTYNGWTDLFGWGTSGWNSGANAYQPWSTSQTNSDYYPGGSFQNNLTGNYANADWGVYNQIGDDDPGTWRTLTYDELKYLIHTRADASSKYGAAKVNGMTGVVILSDVFTLPADCGFTAGMTRASNRFDWSNVNTTNIYTAAQWQLMEAAGAVFLPCAGNRNDAMVLYAGVYGNYWLSTVYGTSNAFSLSFGSSSLYIGDSRFWGRSVRLVTELKE